jgi:glycosyltransferase involved in cell wall biosynthesis
VLRPGGVLVLTTRSPGFAWHHPPDRWRFTQQAFEQLLAMYHLDRVVLMDDPEYPGVFVKARKPESWLAPVAELARLDTMTQLRGDPSFYIDGITPMTEPQKWLGLPYQPDGTGYYRFWQPWTQLAQHSGNLVVIPPPGRHDYVPNEDQIAEFDLVARQRPGGPDMLRDWRRWQGRAKLVYETDDNILAPDPSGLPHLLDDAWQASVRECLATSDLVTCSSWPLLEVLSAYNDNVRVIPNFIHQDLLAVERPRRAQLTLCWAGGVSHLQDLMVVQDPLRQVLDQHPTVDLHMLGVDYRPMVGGRGRFTNWQPDVWDYYRAIDGDIGVIPLADTPFNRCRTPIKALEYAALGIPVVASDVEPYRGFVVDGVTGYLAATPTDWQRRLRELINDPAARAELGAKARQLAADHTIQQHWRQWAAAYQEVCS